MENNKLKEPGAAEPARILEEVRTKNGARIAWNALRDFKTTQTWDHTSVK